MNIEWLSIGFVLCMLLIAMCMIKIIEKKTKIHAELKRKLLHITMGLIMLTFPYVFHNILSVGILAIIALTILVLLKHTKLKEGLGTVLYSVDRESLGEIFFVISVFLIFYLSKGDKVLYSIPILILTFADSTAALIGKNYGKKNLAELNEDAKSIEGSFIFFMVAFVATLVPLLLFTDVGREETLIIATIVGFNVALVEMISHSGNDNLLIPLTTYAFLTTHMGLGVEQLRINFMILGVIFILVTIANRVKTWSKLALVETLVVGYLTITLYGIYAIIPPLILFLTVHLAINTFVRLKYYFNLSEIDSMILSFAKGLCFIFLPSLVIQNLVFHKLPSLPMIVFMVICLLASCFMIYIQKRKVEEEEISIKNGYMHTEIVLVLTAIICFITL